MFPQLYVTLIEILLGSLLFFTIPLGQLQKNVILDILQLNSRYPALNNPLPEGIDMDLHEGDGSNKKVIASSNKIDVEQQMISNKTVYSLVIGYCISRPEFNDNLL